MEEVRILGIVLNNRVDNSTELQKIFTEFGCSIKTRLGLHQADGKICARSGLILLELVGDNSEWNKLINKLDSVEGLSYNFMDFTL